jgi:hypothetical protein
VIERARSRGLPTTTIAVALLTIILLVGVAPAHGGTLSVAWDPSPDPTVMGYRVYVGTTSGAYTEIYDVGNVTTFSYNAAEGTTYYFTVAAYAPGPVVGLRSSEVSATGGAPGDTNGFWSSVWAARATSSALNTVDFRVRHSSPDSPSCSQPASDGCLPVQPIGRVSSPATPFAASPDGRLFVIDAGRRLRTMTGRGFARESLIIADRATTLNQVAIDPAFGRTGFMWVSETRTSAFGRRTFTVARYRVVKNRAGERTEIVSGIELPPSGNALFAIGGAGHIYVAIPGSPNISQPYWGTVLRFDADGSVPNDQDESPVIAAGYTFPHAMALEGIGDRVWLNGADR